MFDISRNALAIAETGPGYEHLWCGITDGTWEKNAAEFLMSLEPHRHYIHYNEAPAVF